MRQPKFEKPAKGQGVRLTIALVLTQPRLNLTMALRFGETARLIGQMPGPMLDERTAQ